MPEVDGLEATRQITADPALADVRIVILTTFELDEYVFEAVRHGPAGSWSRTPSRSTCSPASAPCRRRRAAVAQRHAPAHRRVRDAQPAQSAPTDVLNPLTEREREIVALVGEGLSNDEIAERLVLSPATAKTHVSRAMTKLHARDRAQLVVLAYETGLVRPGWTS